MYAVIAKNAKGKYYKVSIESLTIEQARDMRDLIIPKNKPLIVNEATVDEAIEKNDAYLKAMPEIDDDY